jgi:hypothetical protein
MSCLKSKWKYIGEFALICIPVLITWSLIREFGVNVVSWDEWGNVGLLKSVMEHGLRFDELFMFHNEHRILFPKLLGLLLWKISSFDSKFIMYVQQLLPLAATIFLYGIFRKDGRYSILYFLPAAFCIFSLNQSENILWGFQLAFYMCMAFPIMAFCFMHIAMNGNRHKKCFFALSVLCGVISSFSSGHGLFVWFGLICAYLLVFIQSIKNGKADVSSAGDIKTERVWCIIVLIAGILCWIIYFHGSTYLVGANHLGQSGLKYIVGHPYGVLRYALLLIGNSLMNFDDGRVAAAVMIVFATIAIAVVAVRQGKAKDLFVYFALGAFVYGAAASFVYGRAALNEPAAGRYMTTLVLLPVALYLATVKLFELQNIRVKTHIPAVAAVILFVCYCLGVDPAVQSSNAIMDRQKRNVFNVLNYESQTKQQINYTLYPLYAHIDPLVPFLKENNFSTFKDHSTDIPVVNINALPTMQAGFGSNSVEIFDDTDGKPCLKIINAWAVDFNAGRSADNVYVSVDGTLYNVQFFGESPRQDVVDAFGNPAYLQSGFYREIRTPSDLHDGQPHYISLVIAGVNGSGYYVSDTTVKAVFIHDRLMFENLNTEQLTVELRSALRYTETEKDI